MGFVAWTAPANAQDGTIPVTIRFSGTSHMGMCPGEDGDVYFKIFVDGVQVESPPHPDYCRKGLIHCDDACAIVYPPDFKGPKYPENIFVITNYPCQATHDVRACKRSVNIQLEQWRSGFWSDDKGYVYNFDLDLLHPPTYENGVGECHAQGTVGFCFTAEVGGPSGAGVDSDGDGLLDSWETTGFDVDCNGKIDPGIDVPLPQMGADPNHKNLFIELDWYTGYAPTRAATDALRQAFNMAPANAGILSPGGKVNPDGQLGIKLIIDAGNYHDPTTGQLVGDDLGIYALGGKDLGNPNIYAPKSDDDVIAVANQFVSAARRGIFRTIYFGPTYGNFGGITPFFGDFVYMERRDARAIMHELGHSLGLSHGGFEGHNCKPNHVSVMNYMYDVAGGLPWSDPTVARGATQYFIDYQPSQIPNLALIGNSRLSVLGDLNEASLSEQNPLVTPTSQQAGRQSVVFVGPSPGPGLAGPVVQATMQRWVDWDLNTLQSPTDVSVNIDLDMGLDACKGNTALDTLKGYDEWGHIHLVPGAGTYGQVQMLPTKQDIMATEAEMTAFRARLNLTDLVVTATGTPRPVRSDEQYSLLVHIENRGPNPADDTLVRITLPQGVDYVSGPVDCVLQTASVVECSLGRLGVLDVLDLAMQLLPHRNTSGGPRSIDVQGIHLAGDDVNPADNSVTMPLSTIPGFAGFEDNDRQWRRSWVQPPQYLPTSSISSEGLQSMSVSCAYSNIDSPTFDTTEWEAIGDKLVLDVFVPVDQQNQYWVGDIQAFLEVPAAGIYNQPIGTNQMLTPLPRGKWSHVEFAMPSNLEDALLGSYTGALMRLGVNVGSCMAPVLVDNVRFEGQLRWRY